MIVMLHITTTEQRVFNNNYRSRLALIVRDDIKTSHLLANYLEEYGTRMKIYVEHK